MVEVEHLPLSVWTTQKPGPGSVMVIWRQLKQTGVFRRRSTLLSVVSDLVSEPDGMDGSSWKELLQESFATQQHQ